MFLAVPSPYIHSALIFLFFYLVSLFPVISLPRSFFSKFPFLSLLNKMYLSHLFPRVFAGQKQALPEKLTLAMQE